MENHINSSPEDYQIFELWAKYKHFWPWFLFSVVVCVGISYAYINLTPTKCQEAATVLLHEENAWNEPGQSNKNWIFLIAFILGIAIPGCIIWGKENLNTLIQGKNDLEGLSVPLLGVIAHADSSYLENGQYLLVSETGRDMVNETFRIVRTSLDATCGKDKKVVMFTSFEPGCGKTFVALNLAMSFALAGKKIALVDVDMRTAQLSEMSKLPDRNSDFGYCNFLNRKSTFGQLIQFEIRRNLYYKGFDIFPVGEIPLNPAELLMGDQFILMLEKLKRKYDYVFLDCTPLDMWTDSRIVSKHADLSVFIVREYFTDRRKLRELEIINRKDEYNNMAMILNGCKFKISTIKYQKSYQEKVKSETKQIRGSERIKELPKVSSKCTDTEKEKLLSGD